MCACAFLFWPAHCPAHAYVRDGQLRRRRHSLFSGAIRHLRLLFVNRQQNITPVHDDCMGDAGMNGRIFNGFKTQRHSPMQPEIVASLR